ncbi:hypothetical protein ACS5PJ_19340 [Pseudarthrobacter sp. YS3]|uniref:hypothetical protein n=1 Tax=Pseudarthrobacter sp. YS3 TaxID=3453718 RepID=UPI003EEFA7F8
MLELLASGSLRGMLLPPTYGTHITQSAEFTVLSVEIWTTGLVVNIHLASAGGGAPNITLQDHFGTEYSLQDSATLGSRNLQVFTPSVPEGTRSLTIRSKDDAGARPVVTFAVPPLFRRRASELPRAVPLPAPSRLRRPA